MPSIKRKHLISLKSTKIIITNLIRTKKKTATKEKKKGGGFSFGKKKVKPRRRHVMFSKQFATMVKAGLPILNVFGYVERSN